MNVNNKKIGVAITGSFCTIQDVIIEFERLVFLGADITPILSNNVATTNTRFGRAEELRKRIELITGKECIETIVEAEPLGPKKLLDLILVAPCTGNTMGKIANAITDTSVTMAVKAHLRNQKPIVLAIATNDGLAASAKNLGILLNTKNVFFVPFGQDDSENKPTSLVARFGLIVPTIEYALEGKQIEPILV
ncbi:MAG: dipicolinate synthase subunit B [Acetivibrionales bacterium]|jgi:dipicolinate synthase subunit B|nr:dipicolinate synthase subunit B [Clostridiaceae bacterium]